jgi:hypothetical protein
VGLKHLLKKPENQNFLPIKIETAHQEGTPLPYSVAKLNKGPRGTLKLPQRGYKIITQNSGGSSLLAIVDEKVRWIRKRAIKEKQKRTKEQGSVL